MLLVEILHRISEKRKENGGFGFSECQRYDLTCKLESHKYNGSKVYTKRVNTYFQKLVIAVKQLNKESREQHNNDPRNKTVAYC